MKYCLVPLGCQMNQSDSERIRAVLEELGYRRTDSEEEADLLGVVACSVRQKAIDRAYARIAKWNRWKNERNLVTFISGCMLPADKEKFLQRFDLLFHINDLPHLPDMLRQYGVVTPLSAHAARDMQLGEGGGGGAGGGAAGAGAARVGDGAGGAGADAAGAGAGSGGAHDKEAGIPQNGGRLVRILPSVPKASKQDDAAGYWKIQPRYESDFEAYVPIQNGCDKFCTFCAVPYTRGREVSRSSDEILGEVRSLVERGFKTVTLLGQNVNSYGQDKGDAERTFAELLREIGEIGRTSSREFRVYFTSPHPRDMTDEVIDTIAAYDCLANQIHLPLQSGDDKVLLRMNRNHSVERYRRVVEKIRSTLPEATLFTDIIVGFTGESEEQFERTRAAMREFRYDMAFVAMYSPRPGAASARWEDDVPQHEKKRRLHELQNELHEISLERNRRMVGRTCRVLIDGQARKPGYLSGKTEGRINVRIPSEDTSLIGRFVDVRITDCRPLSLAGELVREPAAAAGA